MKCRQDSTGEESAEQHRSTDVPLSNLHGGKYMGFIKLCSVLDVGSFSNPSIFISMFICDNQTTKGIHSMLYREASSTSSSAWERSLSSSFPLEERSLMSFFLLRKRQFSHSSCQRERSVSSHSFSWRGVLSELFLMKNSNFLTSLFSCVEVCTGPEETIEFALSYFVGGGWCLTSHFKVTKFQPSGYAVNLQSMESRLVSDLQAFEDLSSLISVAFMFYCNDQRGWLISSCNPEI